MGPIGQRLATAFATIRGTLRGRMNSTRHRSPKEPTESQSHLPHAPIYSDSHSNKPELSIGCYIAALPYEIRDEIVFWAAVSSPRTASRTIRSIALTSHIWTPHARRMAFVGLAFNMSPWHIGDSKSRLQRLKNDLLTSMPGGIKRHPCRALFLELPYITTPEYEVNPDVQDVLSLFGPTLWVLEVQGGGYGSHEPNLGPSRDHTEAELHLAAREGMWVRWACNTRGYLLPELQRLWVSDIGAQATLALLRATGEDENDCHWETEKGPVRARRPAEVSVYHAFEPYRASRVAIIPDTSFNSWLEAGGRGSNRIQQRSMDRVTQDRRNLDVLIDRRLDVADFLELVNREGLSVGTNQLNVWMKAGHDRVPSLDNVIARRGWANLIKMGAPFTDTDLGDIGLHD